MKRLENHSIRNTSYIGEICYGQFKLPENLLFFSASPEESSHPGEDHSEPGGQRGSVRGVPPVS